MSASLHTQDVYSKNMIKRINITLPESTLTVLNRFAPKGQRSRFIADAVLTYAKAHGRKSLRDRLKQEALANRKRDLEISQEWFPLEEEAWQITAGKRKQR